MAKCKHCGVDYEVCFGCRQTFLDTDMAGRLCYECAEKPDAKDVAPSAGFVPLSEVACPACNRKAG